MVKVIKASQFDPTLIVCGPMKRNSTTGGKYLSLTYNSKDDVYIQSPRCRLPFGLTEHEGGSYKIQISLDNYKLAHKAETEFVKMVMDVDDRIKNLAVENSKDWFGKSMKMELINELYHSQIKISEDWPPLCSLKLPYNNNKFTTLFFDADKNLLDSSHMQDVIQKNTEVIAAFQLSSMWFVGSRFGAIWSCKQCQVFPKIMNEVDDNSFVILDEDMDMDENDDD